MRLWRAVGEMWRGLWLSRVDRTELREEFEFHIQMETERNLAAGMELEAARRKALRDFGGVEQATERYRLAAGWSWWSEGLRDLAYGFRKLLRKKGQAFSICLTLGLCFGVNTSFFAALDQLALESLPFGQPQRLYDISRSDVRSSAERIGGNLVLLDEYKRQEHLFEAVSFFREKWSNIGMEDRSFRGNVAHVSSDFFQVLGMKPEIGTDLDHDAQDGSAWLSYPVWESRFASDYDVVGKTVQVDGGVYRIVGIAPEGTEAAIDEVALFLKIDQEKESAVMVEDLGRSREDGTIWARLRKGVRSQEVVSELTALEKRFQETASESYRLSNDTQFKPIIVRSVHELRTDWARTRLLLLNVGALFVLVIGSVNVANLLFAQTVERGDEFWMRRTLGASRSRILRQCLAECFVVAGLAWVIGLVVAWFGIVLLEVYSEGFFGRSVGLQVGMTALLYSLVLGVLCSLSLGALVAARAWQASSQQVYSRSGHQSTSGRSVKGLRSFMAVWQAAFTLALLFGGCLLVKSFYQVSNQDFGFDVSGLYTSRIHLSDTEYKEIDAARSSFQEAVLAKLRSIPTTQGAALSSIVPTYGYPDQVVVKRDAVPEERLGRSYFGSVSEGYFETMGIALLEGRRFQGDDSFGWQTPVVVDERFARLFYPGESAIGKRVKLGGKPRNDANWPVIVGVVESVRHESIEDRDALPMMYLPLRNSWVDEFSVFLRTDVEGFAALRQIESAVGELDPNLPLYRSLSMEAAIDQALVGRRGLLSLMLGLSFVALVLCSVGVYGSSAFRFSQRLGEIAIRMAIGARESDLLREHVVSDLRLTFVGIALGGFLSWALASFLSVALYPSLGAFDGAMYLGLALVSSVVFGLASYLPGRLLFPRDRLCL